MTGNYTDIEEDVRFSPDSAKEYPLQRDEVKLTSNKFNGSAAKIPIKNTTNEEPDHYIGFVIGMLTVVILILVAAIVFIVFRNQRPKTSARHSVIPDINNEAEKELKVTPALTITGWLSINRGLFDDNEPNDCRAASSGWNVLDCLCAASCFNFFFYNF